jgi:hypothetical protein
VDQDADGQEAEDDANDDQEAQEGAKVRTNKFFKKNQLNYFLSDAGVVEAG